MADAVAFFEAMLGFVAELTVCALELLGILIIAVGSARAVWHLLRGARQRYNVIVELGKALALSLEFKMGAEIVNTAIVRDLAELATLAERCREIGWACIVLRADKAHFDLGTLPKRPSKRYKEISAFADVVDFPRSTEPQLVAWIERHFAHDGIAVSPDVCRAIIARAGHSMDTLANEIEKLICTQKAKGRNVLSACDLEGVLSATSEEDAFALTNALLARDAEKAYAQLLDLRRRRVDPLIVLGSVSRLYGELVTICRLRDEGMPPAEIAKLLKIHEYPLSLRLRALQGKSADESVRALEACRALDLSVKTFSGMDLYVGLDRLVAEFVSK